MAPTMLAKKLHGASIYKVAVRMVDVFDNEAVGNVVVET